jgi:hypothetical protein
MIVDSGDLASAERREWLSQQLQPLRGPVHARATAA